MYDMIKYRQDNKRTKNVEKIDFSTKIRNLRKEV